MPDPELFVGFESGAIGMFRIYIGYPKKTETTLGMQFVRMFSAAKMIQDIKVRHVLSMSSLHFGNKDKEDFTLAIGYYASLLQTISFVSGYEQDSYTMIDHKVTDSTFAESPGIGCIDSVSFGTKAILATGGFDHRIKISSFKTLKPLITLRFH